MLIAKMMMNTFPGVRRRLAEYQMILKDAELPLAELAFASLRDKEFHCLGGSVYALLAPEAKREAVLDFIVAYQTISDYLDNLCDRAHIKDETVFRKLHTAMSDCLVLDAPEGGYYQGYPWQEDGGYLNGLVAQARKGIALVNPNSDIRRDMLRLCHLYIDLQSLKHLDWIIGEQALRDHYKTNTDLAPNLYWWEFAAACGSTLGIFALAAEGEDHQRINKAYMPWISGLHILLDYYIDQEEDRVHGDMNLVSYYQNNRQCLERVLIFYKQAARATYTLSAASQHNYIVDGLMAMYLSDPKASSSQQASGTGILLREVNFRARFLTGLAKKFRKLGKL